MVSFEELFGQHRIMVILRGLPTQPRRSQPPNEHGTPEWSSWRYPSANPTKSPH